MDRLVVFNTFMQAEEKDIAGLAELIEKNHEVKTLKAPHKGLVMMRAEESIKSSDFNLGEVLVTSAEVSLNGFLGFSMVMGIEEKRAYYAAIIMAAYESDIAERESVVSLAGELYLKQQEKIRQEKEIAASTRVNFEVMGGQDMAVVKQMKKGK